MVRIARYDASALADKCDIPTAAAHKSPWQTMMTSKLASAAGGVHCYAVPDQLDSIACLEDAGAGAVRIHHGSWSGCNAKTALEIIVYTIGLATARTMPQVIKISALEHTLVDPLAVALSRQPQPFRLQSRSCCGMYMRAAGSELPSPSLPLGFTLRRLKATDAATLDARWQYRSATSLDMVTAMLQSEQPGNIGIEDENGELAGCASVHLDRSPSLFPYLHSLRPIVSTHPPLQGSSATPMALSACSLWRSAFVGSALRKCS